MELSGIAPKPPRATLREMFEPARHTRTMALLSGPVGVR
jgi:hypothetical protein